MKGLKATTSHDDIEATSELISVKDPVIKISPFSIFILFVLRITL